MFNVSSAGTSEQQVRQKLLQLLGSERYAGTASIIVYTTFQAQADATAKFLRANMIRAASYHAGLSAQVRSLSLKIVFSLVIFTGKLGFLVKQRSYVDT